MGHGEMMALSDTPKAVNTIQLHLSQVGFENFLEAVYLDYFNNFLTVNGFASYYNISLALAERLVNDGREIHRIKTEIKERLL